MNDPIEITLKSAEWAITEIDRLLKEYHECRTEHARGKAWLKLQSIQQKANYEASILKQLIDRNNNEESEL